MADSMKRPDVEELLSGLGEQLTAGGSILPDVQARLEGVSMRPPRSKLPFVVGCAAVLLGVGFWLGRIGPGERTANDEIVAAEGVRAAWVLGDAVVTQHLSSLIDGRAVLVVWSCRGAEMVLPAQPELPGGEPARYKHFVLAHQDMGSDRTLVWSLFVPEADVKPTVQPPTLKVRTADGRLLALSTLPQVESRDQLAGDLASPNLPGGAGITLDEIEWVLQGT